MNDIVRLLRMRNHVIVASAAAFLVWQGCLLAGDLVSGGPLSRIAEAGALVGGVTWAAATFMMLVYFRRVARARAQETLDDELARHNQARVFVIGYWILAAALGLLLGLAGFVALDAMVVVRGLLIIAVIAPLTAFLWLDRAGDGEDA